MKYTGNSGKLKSCAHWPEFADNNILTNTYSANLLEFTSIIIHFKKYIKLHNLYQMMSFKKPNASLFSQSFYIRIPEDIYVLTQR